MSEKWKCNVCGYLHEGPEVLPRCPRCGAEGGHFIPVTQVKYNLFKDLWASFIPHVVLSHFPTGLVPTALLFLILAVIRGESSFERTAFYLLFIAWVAIPALMASGIYDWRNRFGGVQATIFYKKIALAAALLVVSGLTLLLGFLHPDILHRGGPLRGFYLGLLAAVFLLTVLLGHYGGKLALQWKKRKG